MSRWICWFIGNHAKADHAAAPAQTDHRPGCPAAQQTSAHFRRMAAQLSQRGSRVAHQRKIALASQIWQREQGPLGLLERFASRECHALNSPARPGREPQFINRGPESAGGPKIGSTMQPRRRRWHPADPQHPDAQAQGLDTKTADERRDAIAAATSTSEEVQFTQ